MVGHVCANWPVQMTACKPSSLHPPTNPCAPQAEGGGEAVPASSPVAVGKWRLVWTRQGATANPLQKALAGQVCSAAVPRCCCFGHCPELHRSLPRCAASLQASHPGCCCAHLMPTCRRTPTDSASPTLSLPQQVDNWQIISPDGRLENRVQLLPGLRVRALANCGPEPAPGGGTRTFVEIAEVRAERGWGAGA